MLENWKNRAKALKREVYTLWLAYKMPGTPWYARVFAALVVAYAFSPIDLIPDFIPVLGYLDDLILVPLGIALAIKMIPSEVVSAAREEAQRREAQGHPDNWIAAVLIVILWLVVVALVIWKIWGRG